MKKENKKEDKNKGANVSQWYGYAKTPCLARRNAVGLRTVRKGGGLIADGPGSKINFAALGANYQGLVGLALTKVARLFVRIDVPDNIVGQTNNLVSSALGHLGKALGFGLVLECV